jgi:hypothetical protein
MPASHFDVKPMTGRPKFIVRHSTMPAKKCHHFVISKKKNCNPYFIVIGPYHGTLIKFNHDSNYLGDEFISFWQVTIA